MRIRTLERGDVAEVRGFLDALEAGSGVPPLGESKYVDLGGPGNGTGFIGEDGSIVAYLHMLWHGAAATWEMELAADRTRIGSTDVEALVGEAVGRAGGPLLWWTFGDTGGAEVAARHFHEFRRLHKLIGPLPLGEESVLPDGLRIVPFRPGLDEGAWLATNNAAFGGHPENGGWTVHDLAERMARPWFDARGFRLAWLGERLAGFCWTKRHTPDLGEIHVIAVHPQFRGRGLGRAIVIEALWHLAEEGCTSATLYVDTANGSALGLYQSLGFETERVDRCFEVPKAWPHEPQ